MKLERWAATLLAAISFAVVVMLVAYANAGFDLTDEGLYLLDIGRGSPSATDFSQYHVILGWLFGPEPSIVGLRLFGLIADITTASFLAWASWRLLAPEDAPRSAAVCWGATIIVFQLMVRSWIGPTPSYNTLGSWLTNVEIAAVLVGVKSARAWWIGILLGFLLWLHVFVKWPTAAGMAVLVVALLTWARGRRLATVTLASFAGLLALSFAATIGGLDLVRLREAGSVLPSHGYSPSTLLGDYLATTVSATVDLFIETPGIAILVIVGTTFVSARLWGSRGPLATVILIPVVLAAPAGFVALVGLSEWKRVFSVAVAAVVVGFLISAARDRQVVRDRALVSSLLLLLGAPLLMAAGTNVDLPMYLLGAMAPWAVLLAWVAVSRLKVPAVLVPLGTLAALQVLGGIVISPYRQTDLRDQNTEVAWGDVRVDAARAAFFQAIRTEVDAVSIPGSPIVVLFNHPGLAVALERPVVGPTWTGSQPEATSRICPLLDLAGDELSDVDALVVTYPLEPATFECLRSAWEGFEDMELVADLEAPASVTTFERAQVLAKT